MIKYLSIFFFLLGIPLFFVNVSCLAKEKNENLVNTCSPIDRARIIKISKGVSPNTEILTIKYDVSLREQTLPEYSKGENGFVPRIGDPFCMVEDRD